jgi:hypothetical protein
VVIKKTHNNYLNYFPIALACHFLIFQLIKNPLDSIDLIPPDKEIVITIDNSKFEKIKNSEKQIVSPSDIKESKETPETNLLSDKNTLVEKQSLKKGDLPEAKPLKKTSESVSSKINLKNQQTIKDKKSTSKQKDNKNEANLVDRKKILNSILESTQYEINKDIQNSNLKSSNMEKQISQEEQENRLNSLAGISGNPDLLKGIPDGEVTLLNAKADRFAVFVRRVALQVFSNLRNSNWYEIGNLSQGLQTEEITVRAILDKNGKFESFEMLESSKVEIFDKALKRSVSKGAWDRNPPQAALTPEGKINFIFKAKAWVNGSPNGRSRQWIQLATGLE